MYCHVGITWTSCATLDFCTTAATPGLKTRVYDCVGFYGCFNDISAKKLRDSQIMQREMLQQFENLKFCGKNFEENTQQLLSSSDFFFTYISADLPLGSDA